MHFQGPTTNNSTSNLSWIMPPKTRNSVTNPAFFGHQSQKLQALLTKVIQESASATDPDAAVDFLQLIEILSSLLEEAQLYSILSPDELRRRQTSIQAFMSKFETIENAVGDWNLRVAPDTIQQTSRKRARASTSDEQANKTPKGALDEDSNMALKMAPVFSGPYSEMVPLAAYDARETEWWNEPYYD